ncbi:hypothetical protein KKC62_01625 [Patescibacteria group bacterium]|nr:hypothetical protein [Patescibacteria group bacterium]MBU1952892.1 hypothetical protein [Patescibacteria group bacterium]
MIKFLKFLSLLLFIGIFLGVRLPRLGTETFNSDEVYWHDRSEDFLNALSSKNYAKTFQKYHPGVPIMWELTITSLITSKLQNTSVGNIFANDEKLHMDVMLGLDIWLCVLAVCILLVLSKALKNWWLALLCMVVLVIEPFYLGNSRLIHHDAQISLYVILALAIIYLNTKKFNFFQVVLASLLLSLAALSKTLFIGAFVFSLLAGGLLTLLNQGFKKPIYFMVTLLVFSVGFYFALFPALWVEPIQTLNKIFIQSRKVGEDDGHGQIFFGVPTKNPGPFFYPILFIIKNSLFLMIGFVIFVSSVIFKLVKWVLRKSSGKLKDIPFEIFAGIFYLGYFCVLQYFSKKVDRYVIPIYPFFAIGSVFGWAEFVKKRFYLAVIPLFLFVYSVAIPLYKLFPHYLLYNSPIYGDASVGNEIIGQKLFGIGVFELRDKIIFRFGEKAKIGASDFEPLASIYKGGYVDNVLVAHPNSYNVMVLGPNKPFPPSMKNEPTIKFYKVDSVYINGLEFWRIYHKRVIH